MSVDGAFDAGPDGYLIGLHEPAHGNYAGSRFDHFGFYFVTFKDAMEIQLNKLAMFPRARTIRPSSPGALAAMSILPDTRG